MEVVVCPDSGTVAKVAAEAVIEVVRSVGREVVLGVATGSSPLELYGELAAAVDAGTIDLSHAWAFALDEYVGLDPEHAESYRQVIRRTVTEPLHMDPARVFVPDGSAPDIAEAADEYERLISKAGGIDVQILGVGTNGHIGFNEPGSEADGRTRREILTANTRQDNARFFNSLDEVPRSALTQGLGTIMEAGKEVLVATGEHKADAIAALVEGPITLACPASILRRHPRALIVVDEAAASKLSNGDLPPHVTVRHYPERTDA